MLLKHSIYLYFLKSFAYPYYNSFESNNSSASIIAIYLDIGFNPFTPICRLTRCICFNGRWLIYMEILQQIHYHTYLLFCEYYYENTCFIVKQNNIIKF